MSLGCYNWHTDLTPDIDGSTLEEFWNDRNCALSTEATATLYHDGSVDDFEVIYGADIYCGEHDTNARDYDTDELIRQIDEDSTHWICQEDHHDWEALIFPDENAYDEHRANDHDDQEPGDAEVQPNEPQAVATTCPHPHPRISPTQRRKLQDRLNQLTAEGRLTRYDGFLAPPDHKPREIVLNCDRVTDRLIQDWQISWPGFIYIDRTDRHIYSPSGDTSHTAWA